MKTYVLRRLFQLLPILLAITFLSFGMMRIAGSDVVEQKMENTGSDISQEVVDAAREELPCSFRFTRIATRSINGTLK